MATQIPSIPTPAQNLIGAVEALKQTVEVREGRRGDPLDAFVSYRNLKDYIVTDETIVTYLGLAHDHTVEHITPVASSRVLGRGSSGSGDAQEMVLSSDYGLTFTYAASSLKINTSQDLQAAASPTFVTVKLSGLTDGYIPYHVADATGLANSSIYMDGTTVVINSGALRIGVDDTTRAAVSLYGSDADNAAVIFSYLGANHDAAFHYWRLGGLADDYQIGPDTDIDMFVFKAEGDLLITGGTVSCYDLTSGYVPYHVSNAAGLANSNIQSDGSGLVAINSAVQATKTLYISSGSTYGLYIKGTASGTTTGLCIEADGTQTLTIAVNRSLAGFPGLPVITASTGEMSFDYPSRVFIGTFIDGYETWATNALIINQTTADNATLILASSDVVHPITTLAPTNAYLTVQKVTATGGGVMFRGFSDLAGTTPVSIRGNFGVSNPTDTVGAVEIVGTRWNGVASPADAVADLDAAETIFAVKNNATLRFAVFGDGHIAVGESVVHSDDLININFQPVDDTAAYPLQCAYYPVSTQTGTYTYVAYNITMLLMKNAAGTTNSGTIIGQQINCYASTADFAGTLNIMEGSEITYGLASGATGTINTLYGLYLYGYCQTGNTVGTLYDLYMTGSYTGTVTTHYGIYQVNASAPNYLASKLIIGLAAAASTGSTFNTRGLVVNQTSYDDELLTLQSGDISTPFTTLIDDDTFFCVKKYSAGYGGAWLQGWAETGAYPGLVLSGYLGSTTPTVTIPAIRVEAYKLSGTTSGALAATEMVLEVCNSTTSLVTVLGSGYVGIGTVAPVCNLEVEDNATTAAMLVKLTQDDETPYGLIIGNDTYSTTDTNGLRFMVKNTGAVEISWTAGDFTLGPATDLDALKLDSNKDLYLTAGDAYIYGRTANALTIGNGAAGADYTITFNGETNDGVLTWMEDEDYFQFGDDLYLLAGEHIGLATAPVSYRAIYYNETWSSEPAATPNGAIYVNQVHNYTLTGDKVAIGLVMITDANTINQGASSGSLYGGDFLTYARSGTVLTNLKGIQCWVYPIAGSTVTTAYGIDVRIVGTAATTSYAIYATGGTWGLYVNSDANYLEGTLDCGNLEIGHGAAGVDYTLSFNGETNDCTITWMEDEAYLNFSPDVYVAGDMHVVGGSLYVTELAAAQADFAGKGQLWIKNNTPNELWFTDDAGTDHQIAFVP